MMGFDTLLPPVPTESTVMRVGLVEAVDAVNGAATIQISGVSLPGIPYLSTFRPVVGKPVWVLSQGSWMAIIGAAAGKLDDDDLGATKGDLATGGGAGADEVFIGDTEPTDPAIEFWLDTSEDLVVPVEVDDRYVNANGDTMNGNLIIENPDGGATPNYLTLIDGAGRTVMMRPSGAEGALAIWDQGENVLKNIRIADPTIDIHGASKGYVDGAGKWSSFSPGLAGTGWSIGNGTITGSYSRHGDTVEFNISMTVGSTTTKGADSTVGAAIIFTNLPGSAVGNFQCVGRIVDVSAGSMVPFMGVMSGTSLTTRLMTTSPTYFGISANQPVNGLTTGDLIQINGTYQAA
jgi:hypothetical protein